MNQNRRKQTDLAVRLIYHRAISHRFDGIMHQAMLIWKGEGRAKAVDLDSKHIFSGQMPSPL